MTAIKTNKGVEDGSFNLESILQELGSFGRYQLSLLLLLSVRDAFLTMCNFNYVFVASTTDHRCFVPECESPNNLQFNTSWYQYASPNFTNVCHRLASQWGMEEQNNTSEQQWMSQNSNQSQYCDDRSFNRYSTISCDKLVYEDNESLMAEFNLGCEPWKLTMVGTVHNIGLIFSSILSGLISDRYGRKVIIVGTPMIVGIVGIIKSFSVNYWMLLVLEFIETAFGYGNASLVLTLEAVNQQNRVIFSSMSDILASFGAAFFGLIAWAVPYWRNLLRAIYAPLLIAVFYIFLIDEGVRWLLAHDKHNEAIAVLNKVAKMNNVTLSTKAKESLMKIKRDDKAEKESQKKPQPNHLRQDLKSKKILLRMALMSVCFIFSSFAYFGPIINSTSLVGNRYLNFAALILVSVPTRVVSAYTLTKFGRKAPICVAYCFCAVCFISSAFVPKSLGWASVVLYVGGKMGSSYGNFALYVVAAEVFPTTSRNSLMNIVTTIGRIGSILAPQAPLLAQYMPGLPSIVFGLVALVPCLLSLLLPETSQSALPDRVVDVEADGENNDEKHSRKESKDAEPPNV